MENTLFDLTEIRAKFPALREADGRGRPFVYFDGPGGTQVPQTVIDAMARHFRTANANHGGQFITSRRNDAMIEQTREAMADFLNAGSSREIVFGANMTTLTYRFSRAIGRHLDPGDEIIITRLDHDANNAPWAVLEENGIVIKRVDFDPRDCRLNLDQFESFLTGRTRLVAVGYASNAVGTINPVEQIAALTHKAGAWLWIDAVHYAPHGPIDVQAIDCDFLVVSAYKFFGPHVGVLRGRLDILQKLEAYKVRPADPDPPGKFETGTLNHEGLAGISAAIDYLAELGRQYEAALDPEQNAAIASYQGRRRDLKSAMILIREYERSLFGYMLEELQKIPGTTVYGIMEPQHFAERCPTLAFRMDGKTPKDIATALGNEGIFVWDGNYYAISVTEQLGLEETGGMVRVGIAHYNTREEVDRFIAVMKSIT